MIPGLVAYDRPPLSHIIKYDRSLWQDVRKILAPVRPGDVVLADFHTRYLVPVLTGGRVVAWLHPVYWVPGLAQRGQALKHVFETATDDDSRAVITRYQVRWILLNRREVSLSPKEEVPVLASGCVMAERDSLVLVDFLSSCPTSAPEQSRPDAGPVNAGPRT